MTPNTGRESPTSGDPLGGGDPVGEVLAALVDPTRRRVLDAVATRGQATATVLAAELPVSRQAVVKHLAVLDRAGLVEGRRAGREVRYAVRSERLADTARWMARVAAEWDDRLAAIKRLAESGDP
jgi:DNA-binding transcriptional ArsR family regulator